MMWAVSLRLNEIIDENNPFVTVSGSVEKALYNILLNAYRLAYVNAVSLDEFKAEFKFYWDKNIARYTDFLNSSTEFYQKMFKFRNGTSGHAGVKTTTNKQTKTETFTPTETVTKKYDHTMTQGYVAEAANNKTTEKRFEQNAIEQSTGADTTTTYKYGATGDTGDKTTRGGTNTTKTVWSGDPDTETNDLTITDSLSDFSAERFEAALRSTNVYDLWIDEFSPLFSEVIYYE